MKCTYYVAFSLRSTSDDFITNELVTINIENPDNQGQVVTLLHEKLKRSWGNCFEPTLINFWKL